jgi:hypothetical protein
LADDSASTASSDSENNTDIASPSKNGLQKSPSKSTETHNRSSEESEEFDDDMVEGLKGQWTIGTEIYYGASERSGGYLLGCDIVLFHKETHVVPCVIGKSSALADLVSFSEYYLKSKK